MNRTFRKVVDRVFALEEAGNGPSSGGRSDATPTLHNATDGNLIDFITAKKVILTLDTDLVDVAPAVLPTVDGQEVFLIIDQPAVPKTITFDEDYYEEGDDVSFPDPIVGAVANSRYMYSFVWHAANQKYSIIGFVRGY
jgi:hypothetical protein